MSRVSGFGDSSVISSELEASVDALNDQLPLMFKRHKMLKMDKLGDGLKLLNSGDSYAQLQERERLQFSQREERRLQQSASGGGLQASRSLMSLSSTASGKTLSRISSQPSFVSNERLVFRYHAYFQEGVAERETENFRVRRCTILLYLEDQSIQVIEPQRENSGIPQGNFIKRHCIPRPPSDLTNGDDVVEDDDPGYYTNDDLFVGAEIMFYGRTFIIVDADGFTRRTMAAQGRPLAAPLSYPENQFESHREARLGMEYGGKVGVFRGKKQHPMKTFQEASLGKFTRDPENLRRFLDHDRHVLRIYGIWDDRQRLYGTVHHYSIHYFLADNTVEVREEHAPNSGSDPYPRLLNRCRLPRESVLATSLSGEKDEMDPAGRSNYYAWEDMVLGAKIHVYGREILLIGYDPSTQKWFEDNGFVIPRVPIAHPSAGEPTQKTQIMHVPPPYTGFGSEADSLGSVHSIVPKAPKQNWTALTDKRVLRFSAHLDATHRQDEGRKFLLVIRVANNSIAVFEQAEKNSGIIGGKFLERGNYCQPNGAPIKKEDFFLGARVCIQNHVFVVDDMDEFTLRFMEGNTSDFSMASAERILDEFLKRLQNASTSVTKVFRDMDERHCGNVSLNDLGKFLRRYYPDINEQEVLAVHRAFDTDKNGFIDVNEFSRAVMGHDYGEHAGLEDKDAKRGQARAGGAKKVSAAPGSVSAPVDCGAVMDAFAQRFTTNAGDITQAFRLGDVNITGRVNREEFISGLTTVSTISSNDAESLAAVFFADPADDALDYVMFTKSLAAGFSDDWGKAFRER